MNTTTLFAGAGTMAILGIILQLDAWTANGILLIWIGLATTTRRDK